MFLKKYNMSNESEIPHGQGIYAFYIDMFSPLKLGLLGKGPFSKDQLLKAKKTMMKKSTGNW